MAQDRGSVKTIGKGEERQNWANYRNPKLGGTRKFSGQLYAKKL